MSEDYKYACQRAELLGLPTPSEDEWAKSEEARKSEITEEDLDNAKAQELDETDEGLKRVGGGLDELSSILCATQKKINRFKTVCGSLSTLLKVRAKSHPGTPEHKARKSKDSKELNSPEEKGAEEKKTEIETIESENPEDKVLEDGVKPSTIAQKKIDLDNKLGSHIDKLDCLINKAENAQYSMQHQTKQMKKILK